MVKFIKQFFSLGLGLVVICSSMCQSVFAANTVTDGSVLVVLRKELGNSALLTGPYFSWEVKRAKDAVTKKCLVYSAYNFSVKSIKPQPKLNSKISPKSKYNTQTVGLASVKTELAGRTFTVKATAYSYFPGENITAGGHRVKRGTIAVNPKYIPLGTRLYVEGYGYGVADDTGGVIKGDLNGNGIALDLFMTSENECNRWGVRKVKVTILD